MPNFGKTSKKRLNECHPLLKLLFINVVNNFDCSVLCGIRTKDEQNKMFKIGKSKLKWPYSKHNIDPDNDEILSRAVDVVPYPVDWKDLERFYYFSGVVKGTANSLGIKIRWGGDWDGDNDLSDNKFNDLPHFELSGDV